SVDTASTFSPAFAFLRPSRISISTTVVSDQNRLHDARRNQRHAFLSHHVPPRKDSRSRRGCSTARKSHGRRFPCVRDRRECLRTIAHVFPPAESLVSVVLMRYCPFPQEDSNPCEDRPA